MNRETYYSRKFGKRNKKENKSVELNADEKKDEQSKVEEKPEEELKYESGCIIKLSDLPEKITFKEIKPRLVELASVQYVDIFPETRTVSRQ